MTATRRTLLKTAAATALSALAHPVLAAPNRAASPSNRSNTMTATLHYQNAELSYQLGGKADAPAIVLLHGELGSAEDFAPLLPRLQAHFRTLAIDTRGHGRSTRGDVPLTYAQTADDARQIIEAVGMRQFHLFGFSDGGVTAYRIAAADARVQSVLTVGAQWHSRDTPREMMASLTVADVREMPEQVAAYQKHNPRPDLDALVADLRRLWTDDTAAGVPNENTTNIKAPVLAVRGEDDFLLSAAALNGLRQVLPAAHLMNVPFAAHEVIKEQPDILWAAMKVFYQLA